jgi:D-sedoheptulose 7-phosphate isomerase
MDLEDCRLSDKAKNHLYRSAKTKQMVAEHCLNAIVKSAGMIANALKSGGKVLLCGNGGSAADCQHMAAEFVSLLTQDFNRPGLKAVALTTDSSFLTAYANDFGFDGVFERQVQTLGSAGDVLIGISTSGNSKNVIRAVRAAADLKMHTIVLTGSGGQLVDMATRSICVPSSCTQFIQESHLAIEHIICDLVEGLLFDKDASKKEGVQ